MSLHSNEILVGAIHRARKEESSPEVREHRVVNDGSRVRSCCSRTPEALV